MSAQVAPTHFISPDEAASRLGVTTRTIRQFIANGDLKGYRLGKRIIRIDSRELDSLLTPIPTVNGGGVR